MKNAACTSSFRRAGPAGSVLVVLLLLLPPTPFAMGGEIDLATVDGIDALPGGEGERRMLARNGFVVLPRIHKQIFSLYIGGGLPYYVTTDSVHHTYHVLFESALKEIEQGVAAQVRAFLERLHARFAETPLSSGGSSADGRALAISHVAVAARLLGVEATVPPGLAEKVDAEVRLATAARGIASSPLFGVPEDYALYRPRGFYAGDPTLEAWFRAATWLGRRGFRVRDVRETWAALHLVREIQANDELSGTLAGISSFLDWMIGPPDDLMVAEYDAVLGAERSDAALAARFEDVRRALAALRAPEINAQLLAPDAWKRFRDETKGLRLLPSRRTPDAWLFQRLAEEDPAPGLPTGLEVALALGSERAGVHRTESGERGRRRAALVREAAPEFQKRLDGTHYGATLRATAILFDGTGPLCGGSASAGAKGVPTFPPSIFGSGPWNDRLLTTGLAGWTSLRHAWVLHAKTTRFALGLTEDPTGVVEPAPRYYAALAGLARTLVERVDAAGGFGGDSRVALAHVLPVLEKHADESMSLADMETLQAGLQILEVHGERFERLCARKGYEDHRDGAAKLVPRFRAWLDGAGTLDAAEQAWVDGLADSDTRVKLLQLAELLDALERIAETELRGEAVREKDAALIREYGKQIAALNFYGGNSWLSPHKQMGLVAAVAADPRTRSTLESAVGGAMELYVALPLVGGGHRLYQGGVYSWYEFASSRPSTDAEWLGRVQGRRTPPLPAWTASYVKPSDTQEVVARIRAGEIVDEVKDLHDPAIGATLLDLLEHGEHETARQDMHLAWVATTIPPYAEGELRLRILDALLRRLLRADGRVHRAEMGPANASLGHAAGVGLAKVLQAEDLPRLLALLRAPPPDAEPACRRRLVTALEGTRDPSLGAEADALIEHEDPDVRWAGLLLRTRLRYVGVGTHSEIVHAVMAYLARTDDDRRRFNALLKLSVNLDEFAEHLRPEHLQVLTPLLQSEDPDVVGKAAGMWGHAVSMLPAADPYFARATTWLAERFRSGPWAVSVGCIEGLAGVGTQEALDALVKIAGDATVDVTLRQLTIDPISRAGEAAVPHLFRLCFDETKTGDGINDHDLRMCDEAAEALDRILERKFRWPRIFLEPADYDRALERIRAEARERGYAP